MRRETPPRSQVDFVPDDLRAARLAADGGNIARPADLCELVRADDRAGAVLRTRVLAETGAALSFEAAPKGRLRRRALRAAQAEEDWTDMVPDSELEELLFWRRTLGIGFGRLDWFEEVNGVRVARVRNGRNVPRLKCWHPRALWFDWWGDRKWWVLLDGGEWIEITPGDGEWVLLTGGTSRPWVTGLWVGMAVLVLVKMFARDDWADFSDRYAHGFMSVKTTGLERDDRIQLRDDLRALGRDGVVVLPEGVEDVDVVQYDARTADIYRGQIDLANTSMSVTAIGTNLPTEVSGGAGTGATAQGHVRQDYLEADAGQDTAELRAQIGRPWALANFGDAELAPWPVYDVTPAERAAIQEWHAKQGVVSKNEIRERLGMAPREGEDELMVGTGSGPVAPSTQPATVDPGSIGEDHARDLSAMARMIGAPFTAAEIRHLARLPRDEAVALFTACWTPRRVSRKDTVSMSAHAPERQAT